MSNHPPTPQQAAYYAAGADPRAGSIALDAKAGCGKCLGVNTPVLLASGSICAVQDIQPGDFLAGPLEPRKVLTTSTGHGDLVQITPTKGDSWVCNTDHILTLTGSNQRTGQTIDISVKDFLQLSQHEQAKNWKLVRAPINYWNTTSLPIQPYMFGLWLGDGTTGQAQFTNEDLEILVAIERWATAEGYTYTEKPTHSSFPGEKYQERCKTVTLTTKKGYPNPFRAFVRALKGKWIPQEYLTADRDQRLQLLAGIIDSDGSIDAHTRTTYEVTFRDEWLAEDLRHLARSLGFAAYTKPKKVAGSTYYRTHISGNTWAIPVRLPRKQATVREQIKRVEVTGFTVKPIGQGSYYGFTLDGDGRFLLGDFTITHNTSSQAGLAKLLPGSGLATSVLRNTVADLAKVMPPNWETKGLHSLGFSGIRKKLPSAKVDSRGNALYEFVKEVLKEEDAWWKLFPDIKALVEQSMLAGIVPSHERFATTDTYGEWELLADRFDIDMTPLVYETARNAVIHLNKLALAGTIQFTHMLTLPLFFGFPVNQYPKIIVDEAQDLNILQHLMVAKALRYNGRIFVTGDPNQAIMAFSGALANSFHQLVSKFDCAVLPLTWCWRCGTEIIQRAQLYVPSLEAPPGAHIGLVREAEHTDLESLPRNILCRNNAPLARIAMRLFVSGYSVECAGKDIGTGLKSTINRLASSKTSDSMKTDEFMSRLNRWADREIERRPARKHSVNDKRDALWALAEHHKTVGAIRKHIDNLYVNTEDGKRSPAEFQLSTIHKAKGREWDKVGFLDAHLIPARWAKQDWELEQESNLAYVGITRAKQELVYLNSEMIQ